MKFKASYFKTSGALIREDFRRYWIIPAVAVIAYFMCAVFPIIMTYNDLTGQGMANYIQLLLTNKNPIMIIFNSALPIITAVVLCRYMHQTSSAAVVHSMPFTRNTLYNSHLAAGFCMSILPTIFCGIILLIISKPVYSNIASSGMIIGGISSVYNNAAEQINVFARTGVLTWLWQSILIIAVIYCLSAFVASITGNSILHLITSAIFIVLAPAFLGTLIVYFSQFIYGYTTSDAYSNFVLGLCPLMQPLRTSGSVFSIGWVIFYLVCIALLYAFGNFLYMNKKLERATESFSFKPVAVFMSYVTAFFGMTAFGFYFYAMGQSNTVYMYIGFAAGAVLIFLIAELIIVRSWHIFHKGTFKKFGAYCAIAILFLASLNFDIFGYETRLPKADNVDSVYLQEQLYSSLIYGDMGYSRDGDSRIELKNPENIAAALRFHQFLIDSRHNPVKSGQYKTTSWYLDYTLKSGASLVRQYSPLDTRAALVNNPDIKVIIESQEYKSQILVANLAQADKNTDKLNPKEFTEIIISGTEGNHALSTTEQREFYGHFKEDIMTRHFEDMIMPKAPFINVDFEMNIDQNSPQYSEYQNYPSRLLYNIDASFAKTIGWLKEKGYYDDLNITAEDVAYITIDKIQFNENGYPVYKGAEDGRMAMEKAARAGMPVYDSSDNSVAIEYKNAPISETPPAQTATMMVLSDKAQIDLALHSYSTNYFSTSVLPLSSYVVTIYVKNQYATSDVDKIYSLSGYYFDETIPAEFAAYFK